MKGGDLAKLLREYGVLQGNASKLNEIATGLEATASSTVAATLKKRQDNATAGSGDPATARQLQALAQLVSPIAKAGVTKDIDAVAKFVGAFGTGAFQVPLAPSARRSTAKTKPSGLNEAFVAESLRQLTAALGKEGFAAIFADVTERASAKESVAIAKLFAPGTVRNAADAKKKIWSRHQALLGVAAKSRATSGRSAA